MLNDDPPPDFLKIDFARGRPEPTFNTHIGNLYVKRGEKGTRDEFVMGFRVHPHMCNPAGGLHGGMMMTVADLVGGMGAGTLAGLRKFLPTVNMTFDFVAPARAGDWVEGRAELVAGTFNVRCPKSGYSINMLVHDTTLGIGDESRPSSSCART